jgi:GT2 family glycosyltransferase
MTKSLIVCLRQQHLEEECMQILVVNDGSDDGTAEWLDDQDDIEVLVGDGSLYWGGCVDLALKHFHDLGVTNGWVLLMNNDTTVKDNFVRILLKSAKLYSPAVIGSIIRSATNPDHLISVGVCIDSWRFQTIDILNFTRQTSKLKAIYEVQALSGRGVLFPMDALAAVSGMRPLAFPHYLADYDISMRVRKNGWRLLVDSSAMVYSSEDFGSAHKVLGWKKRFFSVKSPQYLPAQVFFWWSASNWIQRITLPIRLLLFLVFPKLRKYYL